MSKIKEKSIDVGEVISRITLTARINRVELKKARRSFLRLRLSMWIMKLAAFVGGWDAAEEYWE